MAVRATFRLEAWKLRQPFSISRDTTEELGLVHCRIDRGTCTGFSEAAGVDYHGESPTSLKRELEAAVATIGFRWDRHALLEVLPAGGARNALDCALWDLEAKEQGRRVWELAGLRSGLRSAWRQHSCWRSGAAGWISTGHCCSHGIACQRSSLTDP
jgi:L-alanine-DL-glutamate epimerase-like enolase superfamily enzyme